MNVNQPFPPKYLRPADVGDTSPAVTIERVEVEEVGRTKEVKPVVYFAGRTKGLILNRTNARKIEELVGSAETHDWPGNRIRLCVSAVEFGGETVDALRIKPAGPSAAMAPTPPVRRPAPADDVT
ncbi:MAG: hypothetical protein AB1806_00380 [Acidobacteriota bacterium]